MGKLVMVTILMVGIIFFMACSPQVNKQTDAPLEDRIEDLLSRMTMDEKIAQISGKGFDTRVNERLGIPPLKMTDGPVGIRWQPANTRRPHHGNDRR